LRTAGYSGFCAVELTAPQLSDLRVKHGHGAENAGETKLKFDQPRVHMELPMKNLIARFVKNESGATAIEYGLIAAGISLAIIAAVNGLGSTLSTNFNSINSSLK
jgi:pilus assembly protein Flp/PilA